MQENATWSNQPNESTTEHISENETLNIIQETQKTLK